MHKKLLLVHCFLFCSSLVAGESSSNIIQTNHPDVYLKNIKCDDTNSRITFNVVNKSDKHVWQINMVLIDPSGDPIAQEKLSLKYGYYINPQSGYAGSIYLKNCKALELTHKLSFTVDKTRYPWLRILIKKLQFLYPILALAVLLISLIYVPTTSCDTYNGNTECYDGGYRIFTELGKEQSDKYNYDSITLKTDVYIIQIICTLVTLYGIYLIISRRK